MSLGAITLMVVAMLVIWGGLVLAVLNLRRSDRDGADPRA